MFNECNSLKILNLSKFDTSSVNNMKKMFYNCYSLKVIDLSNFNMENVKFYDDMFTNISNPKYINLYNTKNDKSIGTFFNKINNNFTVCQQDNIITNPKAYQQCCDFNIETEMCESKGYTTLLYMSTFPKQNYEMKTIPKIEGSMVSTSITTSIPNSTMITTSQFKNIISIPEQKNIEQTTKGNLDNIGSVVIIILGFSNLVIDKNNSLISFYIYFVSVKNYLHSQKIRFPINIHYNPLLRLLQNNEASCTLENINHPNLNKYLCKIQAEVLNIKSIESNLELTFESEDVVVIGISPLAKKFMDNLLLIDNKYLFETEIYILDHSKYKIYDKNFVNITGIVQGNKPKLKKHNNFELVINLNSAEKKESKLNCIIIEIFGNNYTLNCKINENLDGDLQASVSYIDKNLLIIIFETDFDSRIKSEVKDFRLNRINFSKKSEKINATTILVSSLVIIIAAIGLTVTITIILNKKRKNKKNAIYDSSWENLKI
jgi:surface protein